MRMSRHTTQMTALMLLATPLLAQVSSKPASPAEAQTPMIGTLSTHHPIPASLIEASNNANNAIVEGEALLKSGHVNDAIAEFQSALDFEPDNGLAYQRLAEAYTTEGKLDEARQAFYKVLIEGFGPGVGSGVGGSADIWAEYALVLVKTNHPAEAVQIYNHGASMQDYEDSENHGGKPFLKVLLPEVVMNPTSPEQVAYTPEHLQALADALLSYEEPGFGSEKEAIAHMKEAAKLYPASGAVQYYLGDALSRSYYVFLDSPLKDKAAAWADYQADKKATIVAYKKAAELGDEATVAAAKEQIAVPR